MPQLPPGESNPQRSVLGILRARTGLEARVNLPDSDSEYGASPVVDPASAASKLVPQGRGNYQFLGEIARGGMGVILKGHDTDLGRDVAVKVLDGELAKRAEVVQRFVEEAQIGGQLQHPGIVPVYELGLMADERPYFTMKLIKGRTLAALLAQRTTPADNRGKLLSIFESVCQTVAYAHSKSVLHRDLKPANVMVGAFGEVQVVDWGLAKVLQRGGVADEKRSKESLHTVIETIRSGASSAGSHSLAGSVMGTPAYMAPEQAQGEIEKLDERADVFSLGAILCEILTGRPPYEETGGEVTLVHAARADIEPAKGRLDACDADALLKRLCLDCLRPARGARPANAEAVARVMHQYVVSVESRAQQAELAAAEARVKAAEERRARRLTVALGGAIAVALLLGGGGWYWVDRERAARAEEQVQRAARTRTAVEAAHDESISLGQAGKLEEALASAQRGLSLAENGGVDAALLERARSFTARADLALREAERERLQLEQDRLLRERLYQQRLRQGEVYGTPRLEADLDQHFVQAFRDYGVDVDGDDLVPAVKRIRERGLAQEVSCALDDWGQWRRRVHGTRSKEAENILYLAMDLDADPLRVEMRKAILDNDIDTMLKLTSPENLPRLPPSSINALCTAIADRFPQHREATLRMFDQACHLYPGDYLMQSFCGLTYQFEGQLEASLTCHMSALSLRPDDPAARVNAADALSRLGRLTEAEDIARRCVEAFPAHARANHAHGRILLQLGENANGLARLTRSLELEDDAKRRSDLLVARFYNGLASRDEVARGLAAESLVHGIGTLMYGLVDHPDPAQRDPALVLRTLGELGSDLAREDWRFLIEAVAKARLEDWDGALAVIQGRFSPWGVSVTGTTPLIMTPRAYDFLRSLIYSHVGSVDAARESYGRGLARLQEVAADAPAAWEKSDVMRWRREAEAALAK